MSKQETNILAILGLVLAFVFSPAGFVLGIIALMQIRRNPHQAGKGLAIAGIICSVLLTVLPVMLIAWYISFLHRVDAGLV